MNADQKVPRPATPPSPSPSNDYSAAFGVQPPWTDNNPKPFSINWCIRSVREGLRHWKGKYPPF